MTRHVLMSALIVACLVPASRGTAQTESERRMAMQMAAMIDRQWDQPPDKGKADLRFLVTRGGKPVEGVVSIVTEFRFSAQQRGRIRNQGFNPNSNGRWIYEGLDPGSWNLVIEGTGRFEGFKWTRDGVVVAAGDKPLLEVKVDSSGS